MKLIPKLIPIMEPLDFRRLNVYEHATVDYYRYGEYPRYIRPPYAWVPQSKVVWVRGDEQ